LNKASWYCPAVDREIEEGLCRKYCFAEQSGSEGTLRDLKQWIRLSRRYEGVEDFRRVCAACAHCQRD
jgi:hypothetical protein